MPGLQSVGALTWGDERGYFSPTQAGGKRSECNARYGYRNQKAHEARGRLIVHNRGPDEWYKPPCPRKRYLSDNSARLVGFLWPIFRINVFNSAAIVATIGSITGVSSEHLLREGASDSSMLLLLSESFKTDRRE